MINNMIFMQSAFSVSNYLGTGWLGSFLSTLVWGLLFCLIGISLIIWINNLRKYQYFGIVFRKRQSDPITNEPRPNIMKGKAGYFETKTGRTVFRIKYGIMPWHILQISSLPDPDHMLGNMVLYIQPQKDNFVQARLELDYNGNLPKIYPVNDTTKFAAQLEMSEYKGVFNTGKLANPTALTIGALMVILVTGIIVMYFVSNGGV